MSGLQNLYHLYLKQKIEGIEERTVRLVQTVTETVRYRVLLFGLE